MVLPVQSQQLLPQAQGCAAGPEKLLTPGAYPPHHAAGEENIIIMHVYLHILAIAHGWESKGGYTKSVQNLPASLAQNTEVVLLPPGDAPLKSDLHCNATKRDWFNFPLAKLECYLIATSVK